MKRLANDNEAFMMNIGAGLIIGYLIIAVAMISYYCHSIGFGMDGVLGTLWGIAPLIFAVGAMVIVAHWLMDPKLIIILGLIAGAAYYFVFVVG